jgi:hypothetical protein
VRAGRALHLSCSEHTDALEGLAGGEEGEEVVVVGAGDDLPEHVVWEERGIGHGVVGCDWKCTADEV